MRRCAKRDPRTEVRLIKYPVGLVAHLPGAENLATHHLVRAGETIVENINSVNSAIEALQNNERQRLKMNVRPATREELEQCEPDAIQVNAKPVDPRFFDRDELVKWARDFEEKYPYYWLFGAGLGGSDDSQNCQGASRALLRDHEDDWNIGREQFDLLDKNAPVQGRPLGQIGHFGIRGPGETKMQAVIPSGYPGFEGVPRDPLPPWARMT